jgi:hypothetical protein
MGEPGSKNPTQKLRKPNAKQKNSIARAQQNHHLPPPLQQTTAEVQQETPKAETQQKTAQARRETKQIKNNESPTPEDPESTTQFRHNNATARAQQNVPLSPQRPHELRKPNQQVASKVQRQQ